ncbi:alpha/beta hydrolase [Rhodococcus tukisamuensis]|uniref:alpha/beta hydrolase n=1 Tax=Rhodococcus tukisamuensis TaxID=168276 RepID=UPI0009326AD1|nr:alpha/beta hydrolase family protein [Rhodococcus tukisamuensis]
MRTRRGGPGRVASAVLTVSVLPMLLTPAIAAAGDHPPGTVAVIQAAAGSYLAGVTRNGDRTVTAEVYSASMGRTIPIEVILPADTSAPRPTLYLLNGAGGGEDTATWQDRTDVLSFFQDKNVNVVTPLEGAFSYYTDWEKDDPVLGRNKWQTFLTKELPPIVDAEFGTDGVNSIAAISMTATSVLNLAIAAPGLYRSVGAYSGCAETSTPEGQAFIELVVEGRGGGDVTNMWGPLDGPGWVANDPVVNAEKLRGTQLYVSSGSGLPGPHETLDAPGVNGSPATLANQVIVGGIIESAVNMCTHNLANRLAELKIPATFDFRPVGTHSWGYWQDDLHNSWPMLASSMGMQP